MKNDLNNHPDRRLRTIAPHWVFLSLPGADELREVLSTDFEEIEDLLNAGWVEDDLNAPPSKFVNG